MANWKKLASGAAGAAGGAGLEVEDVFHVGGYDGSGTSKTVSNGIDLYNEGGAVWIKGRNSTENHVLTSTSSNAMFPNASDSENTSTSWAPTFNSNGNGFTLPSGYVYVNSSSYEYSSYTFRRAKKFMDVVEYTGDGTSNRAIAHNLGTTPGMVIIKKRSATGNWFCSHRSMGSTDYVRLNSSSAKATNSTFFPQAHTSTHFYVGNDGDVNDAPFYGTNRTYVAYLFAHNNGDGGFGVNGDQDIIKCGGFTTDGSGNFDGSTELGFEPQFLLVKGVGDTSHWFLHDTLRGIDHNNMRYFLANLNNQESNFGSDRLRLSPEGFIYENSHLTASSAYIYMAISRSIKVPDDAADVFVPKSSYTSASTIKGVSYAVDYSSLTFPPSLLWHKARSQYVSHLLVSKKYGQWNKQLNSDTTADQRNESGMGDLEDRVIIQGNYNGGTAGIGWIWKEAPEFFDIQVYKGTGSATTHRHGLNITPEMMWIKNLSSSYDWICWHKDLGNATYSAQQSFLKLNSDNAQDFDTSAYWNNTLPTSSVFSVDNSSNTNGSGHWMVNFLFGTVDGVSKVGSYTGNGTYPRNIDCGFSNGARFVMIKNISNVRNWYIWDSTRGIVSGNDPHLTPNNGAPEDTSFDDIDPYSAGFSIAQGGTQSNNNNNKYIFYAIA